MEREQALGRAWGGLVCRLRFPVLAAWGGVVLLSLVLAIQTPGLLDPSGYGADATPARATDDLVRKEFPGRRDLALDVVFHSDRSVASDRAYQAQIAVWAADLRRLAQGTAAQVEGPLLSADRHTAALLLTSAQPADQYIDLASRARHLSHPGPAAVYLGGPGAVYDTLIQDSERDLQAGESLSIPIVALLLLVIFGGLVASGLPVATGLATVVTALGILGLVARTHAVSIFALNITSVVGLALGIDYSLLMVSRFREEIRAGRSLEDAVVETTARAGRATLISGLTVMAGFGALMLSHVNVVWSIGLGGMLVVGASVLASLTLIPALLATFGQHVDRFALPVGRGGPAHLLWQAPARLAMARPGLVVLGGAAVAALVGVLAIHLNPGVGGVDTLPPQEPARQAQALAGSQLGLPDGQPLIVVAGGVADRAAADRVESQVRQVSGRPVRGPADVPAQQQYLYLHAPFALYEVTPAGGPNDQSTRDLVAALSQASWPDGITVELGGQPAAYQDLRSLLSGDVPAIALAVIGLTLVILGLAFRSLVLPLKAIAMNLLSVGVAYAALVFVFQDGHGAAQLGFTPTGFVDQSVAVVIFAVLFGLSMDYEVFLLTRIREEFLAGAGTREAVAAGIQKTGRIVTSAAVAMAIVFASLVVGRLSLNKAFGLALAMAIVFDATLVRLVLVPAAMAMLDHLNWWPGGGLGAVPSRARSSIPPPASIPAGTPRESQPLPSLEDGPLPDWIAPRQTQPVMPPWLIPPPVAPASVRSSWEVVPHPVGASSRNGMPRVRTNPPAMAPPANLTGAAEAAAPHAAAAVGVAVAMTPPPSATCPSCSSILPAPYMACPACGREPGEPTAKPLYILDTVTGLYNQRWMVPQLEYELARVARERLPLGILVFEAVASTENALRWLVDVVMAQLRDTDLRAVVSRDPPRMFALLPNTDMAETGHVCSRVLAETGPPPTWGLRLGMVWLQPGAQHAAEEVVSAALRSAQSGRPELM